MNLNDVRAQYPAYKDVDDQTLADALYRKYYSHADRREFDARIGLDPYDTALETMGKAAVGTPGNVAIGVSGLSQQLAEGEAGAPNALLDRMGPDFKLSERPNIDEVNLIQWGRSQLGLDTSTPLTDLQRRQIEELARTTKGKTSFTEYLRSGAAPLGTDPTRVAMADLKGQLERQQIAKSIPEIDATPGSPEAIAAGVVGSIAQMAPGYAASIALRNPVPAVALAQTLTQGQSYAEARDAGLEPGKAAEYAITSGFAESVGEAIPLSFILKEGGGKLLPKLFKAGVGEALQESVTQFIQSMLASGSLHPNMTWGDVKDQVITAAVTGAVAGGLLTGATSVVDNLGKKKPTAEEVSAEVLKPPTPPEPAPTPASLPIEERVDLPVPGTLLALPPPEAFPPPVVPRRQPPAPERTVTGLSEGLEVHQDNGTLKVSYGRDGPLRDATMLPDGTIVSPEAEQDRHEAEKRSMVAEVTRVFTEDADPDLLTPQARKLFEAIPPKLRAAGHRQAAQGRAITESRELLPDDIVNEIVEGRVTDPQYPAFVKKLNEEAAKLVSSPADTPAFTEDNYSKALDALRNQGRYTAKAIKDATGLRADKDVQAVRDALVRRGQLVQRGLNDFRLYDVLGAERQTVPDDLPPGAFKEHVIRRVPVNKVRIRQDGKSIGTFGSASEARGKVSELRGAETSAGRKPAEIAIEPAEETAWGVMENRYDEAGNLLGQVVVDSYRDEADAQRAMNELNAPAPTAAPAAATVLTGVSPRAEARPVRRAPAPEALAGRLDEILKRLNKQAGERKLPLLNVRVTLKGTIATPEGDTIEGLYFRRLIELATSHFDASMTTDEIVERLGQVMDHELIHALRQAGVLSPETQGWKTLIRYTRRAKRPGSSQTYAEWARQNYSGLPGYDPTAIEEEGIAEAFRYWASNRRNVVGQPATAFRQIVDWFRRLINAVPDDLFTAIETGQLVEEALRPPGSGLPRAKATTAMDEAAAGVREAQDAQDENLVRVRSREYLRARAQAREDRFGRSGPKTVLGTTPSRSYEAAPIMDRVGVAAVADKYRAEHGVTENRLMTLLPEDIDYLKRVADAQQKGVHNPKADDVAKAYRALAEETLAMYKALGPLEVTAWTGNGPPYASPAEMFEDIAARHLQLRLSTDLFGEGADNRGDSMYAPSGLKTADGQNLVVNDLFRVVHDIYGHGQSGFRDDPRGQYNAYHEHARLLSPEARRALATETLAQSAWANYGPHLRRRDGTVPRETDVDYLPPSMKEFAEQKSFLLPDELIAADPGWALAERAAGAVEEYPRFMVGWHGTPHKVGKFSAEKIGTGEGAQAFGWGLYFAGKREVADYYRTALSYKSTVKEFREALPDDADFDEVMELVGTGRFTPYQDRVLRALQADDWLGFDYPAQAISAAFGKNLDNFDPSQELRDAIAGSGNLYKVNIPSDDELMDWDAPLSEQPPKVRAALMTLLPRIEAVLGKMPEVQEGTVTGRGFYNRLGLAEGQDAYNNEIGASKALREAGIPGHRYLDQGSRLSSEAEALVKGQGSREKALTRAKERLGIAENTFNAASDRAYWGKLVKELGEPETYNYVIYDDSRIEILEENPRFSKFADSLPGGRLYGNPNRSPGGALSKPDTPTPEFTNPRPGNRFFGGDMVAEQLRMVRDGEKGTVMIYMSPGDFLAVTGGEPNPEQGVYDDAIAAGYKASTLPSFVTDGYAGNVRVTGSDGVAVVRALVGRADTIPVVIYPRKEALGLVTALEGNGVRVPWPHEGRQENFTRPDDPRIRYSLTDPFGLRVPNPPAPDMRNIVQQRIDNSIGRWIANLGRSKRSVMGLPSIFDMRVQLQDKMLSIKEMIEDLKERGGNINDVNDTYMLEQLYHGKVVEQMRERENTLMLPLLAALKAAHDGPRKVQPREFEDYLYARHAPERNAYLRSRGAADENPSGMSDEEANDILDRLALAGKLPELEAMARLADRISADTTRTRVDAGLISEEAANASPYRYYVPLRGFAEEELDPGSPTTPEVRARSGKGFSIGGREDRTVTGRGRKAGDILGHLFLQNTEAVIRAQKNEVALSFMRLLQDNAQAGYGNILATAPTRRVVGANGMIHEAGDPTYRQQPDIITAKWKGKEIIARVADPRLARAIKSDYVTTSNDLVNGIINFAGMFNRYLATINTSLNPEFIISNLARDMQTAGILSQQYDIPGFGRKIIGNAPKAMLGIREVLRTGEANSPWAQTFREMQQAGGTTEFLGIHDLETQVAKIRRQVSQTGLAVSARKTMEYLGKVFKFVDDYNKVAENAFRLSAYAAARENGASVKQAAFLAKNLTINFNKGGEQKSLMNAMYLFYNASTQGTFVLLNGLKSKRVQKIVAGVVVGGIFMDILNRVLSDDEDKNGVTDYDDIPDYVLETNFVLMDPLGVLEAVGIKQGYFALPMPYGFNAFFNLGRNLSASFSGSPVRNPAKGAMDSLLTFTDAFNPLGGVQSIWNFIAPTFADPFVDLITNKDFAGNDIVPERPEYDGVPVPDSQKYWSTTSEVPKWVAEHLNRLTGGNEVRKGVIDVSPETLQYAFDYAFGSAGRFVQRVTQLGTETTPAILRGDFEDIEIGDIPFARRVVGSVGSRGNTERYYSVAREIRTVAKELKLFEESGRIDEARALVRSKPVEVSLIGDFEDAEKELQGLRKELRELRASDGIPAARKRDIETKIKESQDRIMAILNRVYFDTLERARQ